MNKKLLALSLLCLPFQAITSQTLDSGFGSGGKVVTSIGFGNDGITALAVLPDGKIIAAGESYNGSNYSFSLVKYNGDGTTDTTFGTDGFVVLETLTDDVYGIREMVVLPNGKILVAGSVGALAGQDQFALAQFNADGTLDTNFGSGGIVTQQFVGITDQNPNAMAVGNDGKIVVVGKADRDIAMLCFNADGTPDLNFGIGGKQIVNLGNNSASDSSDESGMSVKILSDGKILVAGLTDKDSAPEGYDFYLLQCNADGSFDNGFGTGGLTTTDFGGSDQAVNLTRVGDGKILVSGMHYFNENNSQKAAVARYNADGSLDGTYGTNSKTLITFNSNDIGYINDATLQPDGKLLLAGYELDNDIDMIALRVNADGTTDNSFGNNGKLVTDFGGSVDAGFAVAVQPDGKIIIAGRAAVTPTFDYAMARYNNELAVAQVAASQFVVGPNPFEDEIKIRFSGVAEGKISVVLYDLHGRKISRLETADTFDNAVFFATPHHLSKGMYFLEISDGKNKSVVKVIKK